MNSTSTENVLVKETMGCDAGRRVRVCSGFGFVDDTNGSSEAVVVKGFRL